MQSRESLNNNTQKLSIIDMIREKKVFVILGLSTLVVLVGVVFFLSRGGKTNIPENQIVARNGIHWHPKLNIIINGKKQELTDGIGLGSVHQKIHTHSEDYKKGIIHMEFPGIVTKEDIKLENFFKIWGKTFSQSQIFEFKNSSTSAVKMFVNGKVNKDFENYQMHDGDKIEIRYE